MASVVARVFEGLKAKDISVPEQWIVECIAFLKDELKELGIPYTFDNIFSKAYDQWTLSDLRELQEPVFPKQLATAHRIILTQSYCVQVNSMFDISVSAYSQRLKRAAAGDNTDVDTEVDEQAKAWEPKPTRMLRLKLTDGLVTVTGVEDRPIPALRPDLLPGFKVRLHGRIESRKGILFLGPENVDVLGGNVESLIEDDGDQPAVNGEVGNDELLIEDNGDQPIHNGNVGNDDYGYQPVANHSVANDELFIEHDGYQLAENDNVPNDELLIAHDGYQLIENGNDDLWIEDGGYQPVANDVGNELFIEDDEDGAHTSKPLETTAADMSQRDESPPLANVPLHGSTALLIEYSEDRGISMKVIERRLPFWAQSEISDLYPYPPVFASLKDKLDNMKIARGPTVCTVRAQILCIGQKLSVNHGSKWTIAVVIHDGTRSVECDVDDELITRLLRGHTAHQAWYAKKRVPPDTKELMAIESAMESMYSFLSLFAGLIQLEFYPTPAGPTRRPLIKNLRQFKETDLVRLRAQSSKMTTSSL